MHVGLDVDQLGVIHADGHFAHHFLHSQLPAGITRLNAAGVPGDIQ